MVPDRQKVRTDGRNGRTDAAKTISLRLRRGIIKTVLWGNINPEVVPVLIASKRNLDKVMITCTGQMSTIDYGFRHQKNFI